MVGKTFRRLQAEWHYFRFIYSSESKLVWALIIFLLSLIASLPTPISQLLAIYSLTAGALALLAGFIRTFRKWRNAIIVPRTSKSPVSEETITQWQASNPAIYLSIAHPENQETYIWTDWAVNRELSIISIGDKTLTGEVSKFPYELPGRLREIAALSLRSRNTNKSKVTRKAPRPIRFNGKLLRLNSEPTLGQIKSGELEFSRVSYFDGECSNELWNYADASDNSPGLIDDLVITRDNSIRPLEHSQVANIVGISILALTSDDKVVFVRQNSGNSVAPGALASSGSGSLELNDLLAVKDKNSHQFNAWELLLHGMVREMSEESLIRADEVVTNSQTLTGYFRWVSRGCKTEFTGLVQLNVSSEVLQKRRHRGGESAFSSHLVLVPASALRDAAAALRARLSSVKETPSNLWRVALEPLVLALGPDLEFGLSPSAEASWVFAAEVFTKWSNNKFSS